MNFFYDNENNKEYAQYSDSAGPGIRRRQALACGLSPVPSEYFPKENK